MAYRLPPLNALRVFEAAGRHLSFKAAALELNVTPSAVSRGIQTLEDWLGSELFHRNRTGLSLTPAGQSYLPEVRETLAQLARATDRIPGRRPTGALSLSVAPTLASCWLLPKLQSFIDQCPEIQIHVDTSHRHVELPLSGVDLAMRMAVSPGPVGNWRKILVPELIPVCSPAFRLKHGDLSDLDLIARGPLIHITSVSEDWESWAAETGARLPEPGTCLKVDTIRLALDAASQGFGIALGRRPFVESAVISGSLQEMAGPPIVGTTAYWLVCSELTLERHEAKLFRAWLLNQLDIGSPILVR